MRTSHEPWGKKSTDFSPEEDATVTKLWLEGKTSLAIGRVIKRTKNSIDARGRRLDLPKRTKQAS